MWPFGATDLSARAAALGIILADYGESSQEASGWWLKDVMLIQAWRITLINLDRYVSGQTGR